MAEEPGPCAVVVVSFGPARVLADNALAAGPAAGLRAAGVTLVVVDCFSTAQAREEVAHLCRERGAHLVALEENLGFGGGVNAGLAHAWRLGCSSAVVLNPDAVLEAPVAEQVHQQCLDDRAALVAPLVARPDGTTWASGSQLRLRDGRTSPIGGRGAAAGSGGELTAPDGHVPWVSGACVAASRELWTALGGFDGTYFLYWEDVDLSYRCVRAGGRLVVRHDLRVVHAVGGTQVGSGHRRGGKSAVYLRCNTRNRLWFARRHLPRRAAAQWFLASPSAALEVARRGGPRSWRWKVHDVAWAVLGTLEGLLRPLPPASVPVSATASGGTP